MHYNGELVPPIEDHMLASNSYNFSARMPQLDDPCGSNMFAAWQNKLHVLVCGGMPSRANPGTVIKTVDKVVLSLGIALTTEDFFDPQYLVRNMASLFGIPMERMRVPRIVAGSAMIDIEVDADVDINVHGANAVGVNVGRRRNFSSDK